MTENRVKPRIVLAVTSPASLKLLTGFPEFLARDGWDVHLVCSGSSDSGAGGVTAHNIDMVREPSPFRDVRALVQWLRLLIELRPDVVAAGTPKAALLGMLSSRLLRIPVRIYTLRGLRLETADGILRKALFAMEWLTARCSTRLQSVSHSLRDEYISLGLAEAEKIVVLGSGSSNGVDPVPPGSLPHMARAEFDLNDSAPVVGFVGRLTKDKGIDTLAKAVAILRNSGTAIQVLLVGPEEPPGSVKSEFGAAGVPLTSVRHVGQVSDARPYFQVMDVLCLPSRREGFPNVVLEAAVQAVPAVVADVTGARDSVVHGMTGFTFAVADAKALAEALRLLVTDGEARKKMGENARRRALERYSRRDVWELNAHFLRSHLEAAELSERR